MPLSIHLSIHLFFALLAGLIIWLIYRKPFLSFLGGLLGGFIIDFDHFIDYFLVFGFKFKFDYFQHGYQFLKSDKMYVLAHGWEYVIIILIIALFIRKNIKIKSFLVALALGSFLHLATDVVINDGMTTKTYSIIYRAKNAFQIEKLVTPEHWETHKLKKGIVDLNGL